MSFAIPTKASDKLMAKSAPFWSTLPMGFAIPIQCTAVCADFADAPSCELTDEEFTRILGLSVEDIDQKSEDGWWPYFAAECYEEAAQLLTAYIARCSDRVDPY